MNAGENVGDMTINGEQRFIHACAGRCEVLFDVGAHHGEWTRHVLGANPAAQLHCFEPVAASFEELQANGFPPQVVCNPFGLSDASGERRIDAASSSLHRVGAEAEAGAGVNGDSVRLETLDAYCAEAGVERIDLLKVDVEGHELAVLHGAREMIEAGGIRRIQFEYGPFNIDSRVLLRDLFDFLAAYDYDLFLVTPRRLVAVEYRRELENFCYKNFVALHRTVVDSAAAVPPRSGA